MRNLRAARRYAAALMSDAGQKNRITEVARDLEALGRLVHESRELRRLAASPLVSAEKKARVFDEIFGSRFCKETLEFLHLVIDKHREPLLADIVDAYTSLLNKKLGIVVVDVASAVEFSSVQERAIRDRLEQYTQKKVKLRFLRDTKMKGGVVVRIGDTVLDASIQHQLELLRERLVGGSQE